MDEIVKFSLRIVINSVSSILIYVLDFINHYVVVLKFD